MSNDNQEAEFITSDEELELESNLDDNEDVEALRSELEREREARKQLTARAKKAEEQLRAKVSQPETPVEQKSTQSSLTADDIDMRVLKVQGMSDEVIEKLSKIAKFNGVSLFEAQSDDLFVAWKEKHEADKRAEKARMGASRGSSSVRKEKTITSPGLTDSEHKDLWRQSLGK